jgi:hypothetical protein
MDLENIKTFFKVRKMRRRDSMIDSRVEQKKSRIHGIGIFANAPIKKGELVIVWGGRGNILTDEDLKKGGIAEDSIVSVGEGLHLAYYVSNTPTIHFYMNHSCNPNLWMQDELSLIAKRNINTGEELTADYTMFAVYPEWKLKCKCNSSLCRKTISTNDWQLKELQKRYKDHFSPFINRRIKKTAKG